MCSQLHQRCTYATPFLFFDSAQFLFMHLFCVLKKRNGGGGSIGADGQTLIELLKIPDAHAHQAAEFAHRQHRLAISTRLPRPAVNGEQRHREGLSDLLDGA
jgi:hypothetical protein